jgi:hypothetical protein
MKMMVKLAILCAILFLLGGVSFANESYCYEVVATNLDNPEDSEITYPILNFYDDNTGDIFSEFGHGDMSLFFDFLNKQALGYGDGCVGYFKFHGSPWFNVLTGIGYCNGDRWQLRGHQLDKSDKRCFD